MALVQMGSTEEATAALIVGVFCMIILNSTPVVLYSMVCREYVIVTVSTYAEVI